MIIKLKPSPEYDVWTNDTMSAINAIFETHNIPVCWSYDGDSATLELPDDFDTAFLAQYGKITEEDLKEI